jgi:hypothetical protein
MGLKYFKGNTMKYFLLITSLLILPFTLFASQNDLSKSKGTTQNVIPQLLSLRLESNATSLNLGEKAELTVTGTYSDSSTKALDTDIEWIVTPLDCVDVNGSVLTAKKDSNVTIQAKVETLLSNTLNLNIVWVVNGHVLPPEPDPTDNNSTLLGIDVNDNGVRDDVERWIYQTYKDKHPIHIDIAMQAAKAYKLVLETPERAKEIRKIVSAPIYCEGYFRVFADKFGDTNYIKTKILGTQFETIYFNTEERNNAYLIYQQYLSGDSYTVPWADEGKNFCDFPLNDYFSRSTSPQVERKGNHNVVLNRI